MFHAPLTSSGRFLSARAFFTGGLALLFRLTSPASGDALTTPGDWAKVRPMFQEHCYECHGGKKTKGGVDLKKLDENPLVGKEFDLWNKVLDAVKQGDMPPDGKSELADAEKKELLQWVHGSLEHEMRANAGDPGTVTIRRLTNAEYDRTIRDLTGLSLSFSNDFSPDGGGGEGFSNIGDVLFVSPAQLDKYFTAARSLADHAAILPGSGIAFESRRIGLRGPVQIRAQAEQALYVWYQKMAAPFMPKDGEDAHEADYMTACWKYRHHEQTGAASLEDLAKEAKLEPAFLQNWWDMLNSVEPKSRFLDLTRVGWRELAGPDPAQPKAVPPAVASAIELIQEHQRSWLGPAKNPGSGVQRRQQDADELHVYPVEAGVGGKPYVHLVVGDTGDGNRGDWVILSDLTVFGGKNGKQRKPYVDWLRERLAGDRKALETASQPPPAPTVAAESPAGATAAKPAADKAPVSLNPETLNRRIKEAEEALAHFGNHPLGYELKPDALAVQAPAVLTFPLPADANLFRMSGQLEIRNPEIDSASAQWMVTAGEPPDPAKVIPGVLTVWKRQTATSHQVMREFEIMRTTFPDEYLRRLEEVSRNYLRGGKGRGVYYLSDAQLLNVIPDQEKRYWERMMADWRLVQNKQPNAQQGEEWDAALTRHLADFAARAWRRSLTVEEGGQIEQMYAAARGRDLDREPAAREVMVRVLVSPKFLFKLEDAGQPGEHPVSPWELATRLSYFLWASMPDDELRAAAADGSLTHSEVLVREVKRMLRDPRSNALAEEFAGQWLKFKSFETKSNVDPMKFPEFTPELRHDMYQEALAFFAYLIREDKPVGEIISADYTFLNERLAKFYGVPGVQGDDLRLVNVAGRNRGGLLGMGCLLTKNSYPHRTSPVLRGNWLLTAVLGTPTPAPPNNVPKLDDSVSKASTLRARLERHRADPSCAVCHDKIDPLGFALEGFDPIGRVRTSDEAGLKIDDSGEWKDGTKFEGLEGLRKFLGAHDAEFTNNFCRKLIGYAVGRSLLPTDRPLVEAMRSNLAKSGDRLSAAVLTVVQSRQFLNRRND